MAQGNKGDHHYVASIGANSVTGMGAFSLHILSWKNMNGSIQHIV